MLKPDFATVAPVARTDRLVTTVVGEEVIVFDQTNAQIHHLDAVCARVWASCDGAHSVREIASLATDDDAQMASTALAHLEAAGLLGGPLQVGMAGRAGSRRRFLRNAAAAVAIPTIVSLTTPAAAGAMSTFCEDHGALSPDPEDCQGFYSCTSGVLVWRTCPDGTLFDPIRLICDWSDDVVCLGG